jgi:hypothetical protein
LIAPLLAYELQRSADRATLAGTAVILDAPIPLTKKIPIAIGLRDEFKKTQRGEVPDLEQVFASHGAGSSEAVAKTRDDLLGAIQDALTRSFRTSYGLAALLAALAIIPVYFIRRLEIW